MFHGGDQVRFGVSASAAGQLYLLLQGSSGRASMIYPDPRIAGGSHRIDAGLQVVIPADDWFAFDATPGTETIYAVFAPDAQDGLIQALQAAAGTAADVEAQVLAQLQGRAITVVPEDEPDVPAPLTISGQNIVVASLALRHE